MLIEAQIANAKGSFKVFLEKTIVHNTYENSLFNNI